MTVQTKPIELYYWPTPNGWKISIMLEELAVPYEVKYINIGKGEQFAPDFLKIDTEGAEPDVLVGMDRLLTGRAGVPRPTLTLEVGDVGG